MADFQAPAAATAGPRARPRRGLLFSSVGDNTFAFESWSKAAAAAGEDRLYDICLCYYGDSDERYATLAGCSDLLFRRKGSKFQNLSHLVDAGSVRVADWEYHFVTDDDIEVSPEGLATCFRLMDQWCMSVAMPAFSRRGKISYKQTVADPTCEARATNFVEMTCPLFTATKLATFLEAYVKEALLLLLLRCCYCCCRYDYYFYHHYCARPATPTTPSTATRCSLTPPLSGTGRSATRSQGGASTS